MAKSKPEPPQDRDAIAAQHGYFAWSRDPAVGLFAVLPLWLCYEGLRFFLTPDERNGAEVLLLEVLGRIGAGGAMALRVAFLLLVFVAMRSVIRRHVPWGRVTLVIALEGTVYGLLLGPLADALATPAVRMLSLVGDQRRLVADLVGSLGAGIFEELVFRLGLLSLLVYLWLRAARAFALPQALGAVFAVVCSAVLFSWFHHFWGDPFDPGVFLFRTMAGVILGFLMWFRGYGVCVYTHALYDVHYFLTNR